MRKINSLVYILFLIAIIVIIVFIKLMIYKIFNCISIHNGGGITYLSMMHHELDKKGNLIFLDNRAKKSLKPFVNAKIKFFKKNLFRNLFVFKERLKCYVIFKNNLKCGNIKGILKEYYINGIPPFIRFPISQNKVFILFQNKNLFSYINYFNKNLFFKFKFIIYHLIHLFLINLFIKNTDTLIAQTNSMKKTIKNIKTKNEVIVSDRYWKNLTLKFYEDNVLYENYENDKNSNNIFLKKIKYPNR